MWFRVPVEAQDAVLANVPTGKRSTVLAVLMAHARAAFDGGDAGYIVTVRHLAELAGLSAPRSVEYGNGELARLGILQIERRCRTVGGRVEQLPNRYEFPALAARVPSRTECGTSRIECGTYRTETASACGTPTALNAGVREEDSEKDIDTHSADPKVGSTQRRTPARFVRPTIEDVRNYCAARQNAVDAQRFLDYYEANGWRVGRNPMKDWQAAVRTWERNGYESGSGSGKKAAAPPVMEGTLM